jgi:hypothetical protein
MFERKWPPYPTLTHETCADPSDSRRTGQALKSKALLRIPALLQSVAE